jgi:2'-hydroxyisoflavone reductase
MNAETLEEGGAYFPRNPPEGGSRSRVMTNRSHRTLSRRDLIALGAAAGAASVLPGWARAAGAGAETEAPLAPGPAGKKLLILGGTRFLGPALVNAATAKGWTITLFNRGKSDPTIFPDLEQIHGDRNTDDVKMLGGRKWDAVIDTSGYFPKQVRSAAAVLGPNVGQYVFISSISAYRLPMKAGLDESAPIATLPPGTDVDAIDKVTEGNYGALKYLCEVEAGKAWPKRALNIRPGYIVGIRDGSDRFTYWPVRVEKGGEVLVPGRPSDPIQFIDVRDLGDWTIRMVEAGTCGTWHATGPKERLGMGPFLEAVKRATGSNATFTWVDEKAMTELKLNVDGGDFPIWASPTGEEGGASDVSVARALKAGLTFRPLESTVKETLSWWKTLPEKRRAELRAGITPEREVAALAALAASRAKSAGSSHARGA